MAYYIGFFRPTEDFIAETIARAKSGGAWQTPEFREKVLSLPEKLPQGVTVLGTFGNVNVIYGDLPSVTIVETDNPAHLNFWNTYYAGELSFQWAPATSLGITRSERQASIAANPQ